MQSTGTETISSMAVSANGVFVGVGFMEGSIAVYVAFNLLEAKRVRGAHTIFVTSLSFLDDNVRNTIGDCETSLVSVSADCACRLTKLNSGGSGTGLLLLFILFIILAAGLYYCHLEGMI